MEPYTERFAWYAIQVATRKEKQTLTTLTEKGYECFLPLYSKRTEWSDRTKVTSVPLFPGYIFSRFDVQFRLPILVTPNVHAIVGTGKVPAAVPEHQLDAIRVALAAGLTVEPCDGLQMGDAVYVTKGPLAGVEGTFVRYRGDCRLIVSVPLIQRSVAVEMDRLCVQPVTQRPAVFQRSGLVQSAPRIP